MLHHLWPVWPCHISVHILQMARFSGAGGTYFTRNTRFDLLQKFTWKL